MLRIIHTADVHLGARHDDLGEQAAAQRERQFAAFKAAVDLALAEKVDLFLIAGDLFDSNVQPRRSVERVAAELARLAERGSGPSSSRAPTTCSTARRSTARTTCRDGRRHAATAATLVTVLDPEHPSVHLAALDDDRPRPGLPDEARPAQPAPGRRRRRGRIAGRGGARHLAHRDGPRLDRRSRARPTATRSSSRPRRSPRPASTTSPSVTGTPPRAARPGRSRTPTRARPRRSRSTRIGRARSCWSSSMSTAGKRTTKIDERQVGTDDVHQARDRRRHDRQPARTDRAAGRQAGPGPRPRRPAGRCPPRRSRPGPRRDRGRPRARVPQGPRPRRVGAGADRRAAAVARHDRRRVHPRPRGPHRRARGGRLHSRGGGAARRAPARPAAPRGPRGLAVRIRKLVGRDFRRYRTFDIELAPGLTVIRGPNEAGKTTVQRALELALTKRATSTAQELEALRPWGAPADARSIITIDFEQDEEDGQHTGTLEKTFAGARGTVAPRLRGPGDHRPDAGRPGDGRADRDADRGVLPLDRVGPSLRAERPVARRGSAARPAAGVDQRRRPWHEPGAQEARQGAARPQHPRRPQPGPAQAGRAGGRAVKGGARPG